VKYNLTCLTPTLVGDGRELAPIDYMVWKDQVNVLDQRRIFKLFAKGPRLDGYLAQLKRSDRLDFASWGGLAQNYAGRRIAFEHPSLTKYFEQAMPQDLFIQTFATATTGGIYIPGSALKGALRTGAMFSGLTPDHWKKMLEQLNSGERPTRRLSATVEDRAVKGQLKGLLAGDSSPLGVTSSTQIFMIRTSTLVAAGGKHELAWKTIRGSSRSATDGLPVFVEMAQPGTRFEGSWKGGDRALAAANRFAAEILANHFQYAESTGLSKLAKSVDSLRQKLESLQPNQCLLPLGWGGGFLGKAAVADGSQEQVREVMRKLPFYARAIQTGLPFPKTRRIVFLGDEPAALPGWTLLEVEANHL
jgi:CRISPR-associated protein Csm5